MADVIRFDNGLKEYSLNDAVTVRFNPTDIKFIERVFDVFDEMDKKQEAYKAEIDMWTTAGSSTWPTATMRKSVT